MQGSRSLFLNARSARFIFGHDNFSEADSKEIIILGQADQDNATNIAGTSFILRAKEVKNDFRYDNIKNPFEEHKDGESYCYGNAILLEPGEHIKKETLDVDLLLTSAEFSHLKDTLDIFFGGTVELSIDIQIVGMELGHEPWLDKVPAEHNLPVVGYKFIVHSKEMTI
jgi:hypothetical protein